MFRTPVKNFLNKPVSAMVIGSAEDKNVFNRATEIMKEDESSYRVRFVTKGAGSTESDSISQLSMLSSEDVSKPMARQASVFKASFDLSSIDTPSKAFEAVSPQECSPLEPNHWKLGESDENVLYETLAEYDKNLVEMEGQGVLIYDHKDGKPSHVSTIGSDFKDRALTLFSPCGFSINIFLQNLKVLTCP